jgi:CheY-like chemotaxis protein
MTEEIKARIFEPFFTTKTCGELGGTGLGLATVLAIVKQHDGEISVDSTPGQGSCFTVRLPALMHEARTSRPPLPVRAQQSKGVIVIADDEPAMRKALDRTLSRLGFHTLKAGNGKEALALASRTPEAQLVILDAVMPIMDGVEVYERLRELRPDLPVLFISGYHVSDSLQQIMDREGVQVLAKPFEAAHLADCVLSILQV